MTPDAAFRADLVALIPQMRGFARSLCADQAAADDLVQDSLAKALASWDRFATGTNLRAWLFTILRNQFYSERRRSWRSSQLDPVEAERNLIEPPAASATVELDELRRALVVLSPENREALILVAAAGLTYEEVSVICGIAVGTVKSRVSRARIKLAEIFTNGRLPSDEVPASHAMSNIMGQIDTIKNDHGVEPQLTEQEPPRSPKIKIRRVSYPHQADPKAASYLPRYRLDGTDQ
jgi:RNA polymerase sigma-70 factor, ECF subfamily